MSRGMTVLVILAPIVGVEAGGQDKDGNTRRGKEMDLAVMFEAAKKRTESLRGAKAVKNSDQGAKGSGESQDVGESVHHGRGSARGRISLKTERKEAKQGTEERNTR